MIYRIPKMSFKSAFCCGTCHLLHPQAVLSLLHLERVLPGSQLLASDLCADSGRTWKLKSGLSTDFGEAVADSGDSIGVQRQSQEQGWAELSAISGQLASDGEPCP